MVFVSKYTLMTISPFSPSLNLLRSSAPRQIRILSKIESEFSPSRRELRKRTIDYQSTFLLGS